MLKAEPIRLRPTDRRSRSSDAAPVLTVVDIGAGLEMGPGAVFITRPSETDPVGMRSSNAMSVVVSSAIDLLAKFLLLASWRDTGPVCNHGSGGSRVFCFELRC